MKNNSFIPLPPFKGWVLQNFPFIEEDFDAITSYQLWCKVVAYLNNTNNNVNVLAKEVLDIKNYFDNLDVQEEIDNKLDEMAESGQLTDIIAQYLQLAGILAFNTLDDLENAENVVDGSFTKTYGKITYNDGYGAFYKIRTLINTDVIDGDNLVALTNYPTLVAEKIPDATINNILQYIENIQEDITDINNSFSNNRISNPTRMYIDGVNGDDSNDGTTQATAFKTLDRWIEEVNKRSDLRCYIVSPGTYTLSKRVISDCVLHIESTLANKTDVLIKSADDEDLVFYNTHLNFENLTVDKIGHIENSCVTFIKDKINSGFTFYGGSFKISQSTLKELTTEYCNGYLDDITIDNQVKTQNSPLMIYDGSVVRIRQIAFEQPTGLKTNFLIGHSSTLYWGGTFSYTKLDNPSLDYSSVTLNYCQCVFSNSLYNTLNNNYTLTNDSGLLVHGTTTLP